MCITLHQGAAEVFRDCMARRFLLGCRPTERKTDTRL